MEARWLVVIPVVLATGGCGRSGFFELLDAPVPHEFAEVIPHPTPIPFCDPLNPALGACYRFESNGADESMYANPATLTAINFVTGTHGQAAQLGAGSGIQIADSDIWDGPGLTVEMWVRIASLPPAGRSGFIDKDGHMGIFLQPTGLTYCACGACAGGGQVATTTTPLPLNQWTHIACSIGPGNLRFFVNGQLWASAVPGVLGTSGSFVNVGEDSPDGDDQLDGTLDDMRIWRMVRTSAEICADAGS